MTNLRFRASLREVALIAALLVPMGAGLASADQHGDKEKQEGKQEQKKEETKEPQPITVPAGTPMMIRTANEVSSKDSPGRNFSATLEANLMSGSEVVASAGTQVYGQVMSSTQAGRGIVISHASLVLGLTQINIDGTMYPIQTGSFSEDSTGVILKRKSVVIPAGSLLEFSMKTPLTVKK